MRKNLRVLATATVVALTLIVATIVSTWLAVRANRERTIARRAEGEAYRSSLEAAYESSNALLAAAQTISYDRQFIDQVVKGFSDSDLAVQQEPPLELLRRAGKLNLWARRTTISSRSPNGTHAGHEDQRWDDQLTRLRSEAACDLVRGRLQRKLQTELATDPQSQFAFGPHPAEISPDAQRVVMFDGDHKCLRVWGRQGELLFRLPMPADLNKEYPLRLSFPTNERVEILTQSERLSWALPRTRPDRSPRVAPKSDDRIKRAVSRRFVAVSDGSSVYVNPVDAEEDRALAWTAEKETGLRRDRSAPTDSCQFLEFGLDDRSLFIGTDKRVVLIDVVSGWSTQASLEPREAEGIVYINALRLVDGGFWLMEELLRSPRVSGLFDPEARIGVKLRLSFWAAEVPTVLQRFLPTRSAVIGLASANDGTIFTGSQDHVVRSWKGRGLIWSMGLPFVGEPERYRPALTPSAEVPYPVWEFTGGSQRGLSSLAPARADGNNGARTELLDASDGSSLGTILQERAKGLLELSPDHRVAVVANEGPRGLAAAELWSVDENRLLGKLGESFEVTRVEDATTKQERLRLPKVQFHFAPASQWLLVDRTEGSSLDIWHVPKCKQVGTVRYTGQLSSLEFDEKHGRVLIINGDDTIAHPTTRTHPGNRAKGITKTVAQGSSVVWSSWRVPGRSGRSDGPTEMKV